MIKKDGRLNETRINNDGEEMRIIRYGNSKDIDVEFVKDGVILEHRDYTAFKNGHIKNPFFPSVYGVGFIGKGRFKPFDGNGKHTKCYNAWVSMLMRCYDPKYQEKHPSYKGCTVFLEWLNFQNFAEWYYSHFYEIEGQMMNLDKDILHKGNKVYSHETCVFTPHSINSLFVKRNKSRGDLPIGVCKYGDKFKAQLTIGNNGKHLGIYDTPEEAFLAYKEAKEQFIKDVAEEYKDKIPCKLYEAMVAYEVEIDD